MLKCKWLTLVLDVDFMTQTILNSILYFILLEFIMYLRASSQKNVENSSIQCNFIMFQTKLNCHLFNITYLHTTCYICLLKHVHFSWIFCRYKFLGFIDQYVFRMYMLFFLHITQSQYIKLNHFHLTLGTDQDPSTSLCFHPQNQILNCHNLWQLMYSIPNIVLLLWSTSMHLQIVQEVLLIFNYSRSGQNT